jgi:hypothetical protein
LYSALSCSKFQKRNLQTGGAEQGADTLISSGNTIHPKKEKQMTRSVALFAVFAISLLAFPTRSTNSLPLPTCDPACTVAVN